MSICARLIRISIVILAFALNAAPAGGSEARAVRAGGHGPIDQDDPKIPAPKPKVRPDVFKRMQEAGVVTVGVKLAGEWQLDPNLTGEARAKQRQAIASIQHELITSLHGTRYKVVGRYRLIPFISLEVGPDALEILKASPLVEDVYVEEGLGRSTLFDSAPLIGAPQAWSSGFDGAGRAIAILDSGVDAAHPFLSGKVVAEACFSLGGQCPNGETSQVGVGAAAPCNYDAAQCPHGTRVAGVAAGSGESFYGIARGAALVAVQVFSRSTSAAECAPDPAPCARARLPDIIQALDHVNSLIGAVPGISQINSHRSISASRSPI